VVLCVRDNGVNLLRERLATLRRCIEGERSLKVRRGTVVELATAEPVPP
jgi:hypothetical protein